MDSSNGPAVDSVLEQAGISFDRFAGSIAGLICGQD